MLKEDFAHLPRDEVHLDHAGATLCASSQVKRHADAMLATTLGNPHSRNAAGQRTSELIRRTRHLLLKHLNASERDYAVVFTSGCTGAVQLLAQHFRWARGDSVFAYSLCNHNSVLGMREIAKQHGCPFVCVGPDALADMQQEKAPDPARSAPSAFMMDGEGELGLDDGGGADEELDRWDTPRTQESEGCREEDEEEAGGRVGADERGSGVGTVAHLFAYSLECNWSGAKTSLSMATRVQQGRLAPYIPAPHSLYVPVAHRHLPDGDAEARRRACDRRQAYGDRSEVRGRGAGGRGRGGGRKWFVLVDAAKAAATGEVSLGGIDQPDFVAISFYKMMGLPTGLSRVSKP